MQALVISKQSTISVDIVTNERNRAVLMRSSNAAMTLADNI